MTASSRLGTIGQKIWIALRFVVFGLGGFLVIMYFSLAFFSWAFEQDFDLIHLVVSLALLFVGAFMMLYGSGEWRRWGYLWVFLSIPFALLLLFLIPGISGKNLPTLIVPVVVICAYIVVRVYYKRQSVNEGDGKAESI